MDVRTGKIYEGTFGDDREKGTGDEMILIDGDNCTRYCRLASKLCCVCIDRSFRAKCKRFAPKRAFKLVKKGGAAK